MKMLPILLFTFISVVRSSSDSCQTQCDLKYHGTPLAQLVIPACKRGCELYTLALISSSGPSMKISPVTNKSKPTASRTTMEPTSQPVQDFPHQQNSATTYHPHKIRVSLDQNSINFPLQRKVELDGEISQRGERIQTNEAVETCKRACKVAFKVDRKEQEACELGCRLPLICAAEKNCLQTMPMGDDNQKTLRWTVLERTPFAEARDTISSLAGHIGTLVRVSWSSFARTPLQKDDRTEDVWQIQSVHSPKLMIPQRTQQKVLSDMFQMWQSMKNHFDSKLDRNNFSIRTKHDQTPMTGHQPSQPSEWSKMKARLNSSKEGSHSQLDILECISRKSGLPRWFIGFTLFSSVPIAVWLCLSLVGASEEHSRVVKTNIPPEAHDQQEDEEIEDYISEKMKLIKQEEDNIQIV